MASYDLKAILGEKLRRLTDKTLKALVDCMCTVGASLCSLDKRVSALESVELPEGGYKPMQEPVASPSASGTAVQFIESVSQDATGRMTATKKTVRTGSTSQTGVLQLEDSHTSTSTSKAATPKNVKEAYDLANSKQSPATTIAGYGITDAYTKTEVDTFLAAKAEQVNVTNYTSFSDIGAVVSAGNIPYYYHAVGSGAAKLYYQGTNVSGGIPPTVSQVFAGVFNGVLYETRFVNGASAFSAVVETPIFSAERVASSSESSSWSLDDTNVPTRAAVESKISGAMSGQIGGFLWVTTPQGATNAISNPSFSFKNGDWFSVTEAGQITYYENNVHDAQHSITINVNANDDVYWTASGTLKVKPSNSLPIFPISSLSNWDTLTNPGLYQISVVGATNAPTSNGTFSCIVSNVNGNVRQVATQGTNIYYRGKGASTSFSDWKSGTTFYATIGDSGTSGGASFEELKTQYALGNTIIGVKGDDLFPLVKVSTANGQISGFTFVAVITGDVTVNGSLGVWTRNSTSWVGGTGLISYANSANIAANYLTGQGGTIESSFKERAKILTDGTEVAAAVGSSAGSVISVILSSNYGGTSSGSTATVENVINFYLKSSYRAVNGQFYSILRSGGSIGTLTCSSGSQTISDGKFVMVMCRVSGSTVTYHFKE